MLAFPTDTVRLTETFRRTPPAAHQTGAGASARSYLKLPQGAFLQPLLVGVRLLVLAPVRACLQDDPDLLQRRRLLRELSRRFGVFDSEGAGVGGGRA